MTRYFFLLLAFLTTMLPASARAAELYRVRIPNKTGSQVAVSTDQGLVWTRLGEVTSIATETAPSSPLLDAVPPNTVAAVYPGYVLLRMPSQEGKNRSLRIQAKDASPLKSAIGVSIPAGDSLFRHLAPPVRSELHLEKAGQTQPLREDYVPAEGDVLLIIVSRPEAKSVAITMENHEGGEVAWSAEGGETRLVGRVKQPLRGIGRYGGTEGAGSGSILSWSQSLILVSTAAPQRRLNDQDEELDARGGFVIQPADPSLRGATHPDSQILIEAISVVATEGEHRAAAADFFSLPVPLSTGDPLDRQPARVEMRVDGGDWEPLPDLRGPIDAPDFPAALQQALGEKRTIQQGITHLRFVFADPAPETLRRRVLMASASKADTPQRGEVTITATVAGEGVAMVSFYLNGRFMAATNIPPFAWKWNTLNVPNGPHILEIRGEDAKGAMVTSVATRVIVDN